MLRWLLSFVLLIVPVAASAEWREARSKHFIVYSEGSDREIRQKASDLERYDHLLRLLLNAPDDSSAKVEIYLLDSMSKVQRALGVTETSGIAGFYDDTPRGSIALGLRNDVGSSPFGLSSQNILFHEYAHHVMLGSFKASYPPWYVEGFAEYYGTTEVLPDNVMEVGRRAKARVWSFRDGGEWMPLNELLRATSYKDAGPRLYLLYAEGWLLVHYLANNEARKGQLSKYLLALNRGVDRQKAIDEAFGKDATELDKELHAYARKKSLSAIRVTFPAIDVGSIETRALAPVEVALMEYKIALFRGVKASEAEGFARKVRKIAADFPGNAYAASILCMIDYLAGNFALAKSDADEWLKLESGSAHGLMYKGLAETRMLADARSKDKEAWIAARKPIAEALKMSPSDPLVMEAFYDGFAVDGTLPPARAQNALYKAMELVPKDFDLRYKVAADFERRDLVEEAIDTILPSVYRTRAPEEEEEDEKDKAKRDKEREKSRLAGEPLLERPDEMLSRLKAKLAASSPQPASATSVPAGSE